MKASTKIASGMPGTPALARRAGEILQASAALLQQDKVAEAVPLAVELVRIAPDLPSGHRLMGSLALRTGATDIAIGSFERALALKPASDSLHLDLGAALLAAGRAEDAAAILRKGLVLNARNGDLLRELGQAQLLLGERQAALKSFRRALKLLPDDRYVAHMAGALADPGLANSDYVAHLFDTDAGHFDEHLTGKLHYRVPQALADMLKRSGKALGPAIDIGCGTGLAGAALAEAARPIDGIDIAPRMIEKARQRGLYRHLATGDAARVLRTDADFAGPYALAIAADVFIYVGAIEDLFGAIRDKLAAGGLFAFSIETSVGDDIEIRASGRFAHSPAYIEKLAQAHGLAVAARADHDIRLENNQPIAGALYVLERK